MWGVPGYLELGLVGISAWTTPPMEALQISTGSHLQRFLSLNLQLILVFYQKTVCALHHLCVPLSDLSSSCRGIRSLMSLSEAGRVEKKWQTPRFDLRAGLPAPSPSQTDVVVLSLLLYIYNFQGASVAPLPTPPRETP